MALTHLLDTSVFCQPIKDRPLETVLARWSSLGDWAVASSAICLAEIVQGLESRQSQKYWRRYRELLDGRYEILPFDEGAVLLFGEMAAELGRRGEPRPILDLQIAVTARRHGLIVATLNAKHFAGLPGVQMEDWSAL